MATLSDTARRLQRIAPDLRAAGVAGDYTQPRVAEVLRYGSGGSRSNDDACTVAATQKDDSSNSSHGLSTLTATQRSSNSSNNNNMDACLRPGVYADKMCSILDEQREQRYLSALRKPLGHAPAPTYTLATPPHGFGGQPCRRHSHGVSSSGGGRNDEDGGGGVTCTCNTLDREDARDGGRGGGDATAAAQTRSQGGYHNDSTHVRAALGVWRDVAPKHTAGEQLNRHYDWQSKGIDPTQHCFGVRSGNDNSSSKKKSSSKYCSCFCSDADTQAAAAAAAANDATTTAAAATRLLPTRLTDHQRTMMAEVGQPRRYGFDDPATWSEAKRGRRHTQQQQQQQQQQQGAAEGGDATVHHATLRGSETVRTLLSSWAEPAAVSTTTSTTAALPCAGTTAASTDKQSSNSDDKDAAGSALRTAAALGDEATARQLLQPCHYVRLGVQSRYFASGRTRSAVHTLCRAAQMPLSDAQIDAVYDAVAADAVDRQCGIEQFKNAAMRMGYL